MYLVKQANMTTYQEVKQKCLLAGTLWEDPDFPATATSIHPRDILPEDWLWKRPNVCIFFLTSIICDRILTDFMMYHYIYIANMFIKLLYYTLANVPHMCYTCSVLGVLHM